MATFDPESIIGRSYLSIPEEDGSRTRLQIVKAIESLDSDLQQSPEMIKFKAVNYEGTVEEIVTYSQIIDKLEDNDGDDDIWKFKSILKHKGSLTSNDPDYKGSKWNVQIL